MPETTETPKPTKTKRTRATTGTPRRNFATERSKLVQYCRISIRILNTFEPLNDYMKGQIVTLKAVLAELGEKEGES